MPSFACIARFERLILFSGLAPTKSSPEFSFEFILNCGDVIRGTISKYVHRTCRGIQVGGKGNLNEFC